MADGTKPLELLALAAEGTESHFDGTPLAPGVHLRWTFWPELGFPTSFEVQRRFWTVDEFLQQSPEAWTSIATVGLPALGDVSTVLSRTRTVSSGTSAAYFEHEASDLLALADRARTGTPVQVIRGRPVMDLNAKELLLLGSLDPYLARAVGLALIDGAVPPGMPADYRVLGYWGSTTPWPWTDATFEGLSAERLASGVFRARGTTFFSDRVLRVSGTPAVLWLSGTRPLSLRVVPDRPAAEFELDVTSSGTTAAARWSVQGMSGSLKLTPTSSPALTVSLSGTVLRITAPVDRPLDMLEVGEPASYTSFAQWYLVRVRHRARSGNIGTQTSRVARVAASSGSTATEEHLLFPWPALSVQTPAISALRSAQAENGLDAEGRVQTAAGALEVVLAAPATVAAGTPDVRRPVRFHGGYLRSAISGPARTETLTLATPTPGPGLTRIASYKLAGATGVSQGNVQYADSRALSYGRLDMPRKTLHLHGQLPYAGAPANLGPGYVELTPPSSLSQGGTWLQVQLWVLPTEDAETYPTLVGNDYAQSFWLGLSKSGQTYRLRCWLNGSVFESVGTIGQTAWSHVAVRYDGDRVSFFINGKLDVERTANLGRLRPSRRATLCIGCDPVPGRTMPSFDYPFSGHLADVQLYRANLSALPSHHQVGAWSLDNTLAEAQARYTLVAVGTTRFELDHAESTTLYSLALDGTGCVEVRGAEPLVAPSRKLCVRMRLNPVAGQAAATLVGTGQARGWTLGLRAEGTAYRLVLTVGGRTVVSNPLLVAGQWAHIVAAMDGEQAWFYVDGRSAGRFTFQYGRIPRGLPGTLCLGADAGSRVGALVAPFRGKLSDVEVADTVPAPASPMLLSDTQRSRELDALERMEAEPDGLPEPADLVTPGVEAGQYRCFVQGIDLFGRTGSTVYSSFLSLAEANRLPSPGGTRARFLPLFGEVVEALPPDSGHPRWRLAMRLGPPMGTAGGSAVAASLLRYDAEVLKRVPGEDPEGHPRGWRVERSQLYEVKGASAHPEGLALELLSAPLPRLRPAAGLHVRLELDAWVRVEWSWTGTQRLLAPGVRRFKLSRRPRAPDAGPDGAPWAALTASTVDVVAGDVVSQAEDGSTLAASLVTHTEWRQLQAAGIKTLPEPEAPDTPPVTGGRPPRARLWRLILPVRTPLPAAPGRRPPHEATPDDFVPGALVAWNGATDVLGWQLLAVLWHAWDAATGWTLYLSENRQGRTGTTGAAPVLSLARYYPGQRYTADTLLSPLPDFSTGAPSVALELGVAAVDDAGRESPITSPGAAVAVDRRRPPMPPRPSVSILPADVHGRSRARVTWTPQGSGTTYQVYRATDSGVHTRDVEQRRLRTGAYEGLTQDAVLAEDADFTAWLAARWPGWVADWRTRLFVPKPPGSGPRGPAHEAWDAASEVWREWAARFYPALSTRRTDPEAPSELEALALREGNETAFAVVNGAPVAGGAWEDSVNGAVRNRYLYRLRTQSGALQRSTGWGPPGEPAAAPARRPPSTPALTRAEAGDRRVVLHWALNPEPELAEYRLYRALTREPLEELRWWQPGPGEALLRVPDPRLKVAGNALALPTGLSVAEVLGVFRRDEYSAVPPAPGTRRALDCFRRAPEAPSEVVREGGQAVALRQLRPLADGTAVVLVYRDGAGEEHTLGALAECVYTDAELPALTDHSYRLVAVDGAGLASEGSAILVGRAYDTTPPVPPAPVAAVAGGAVHLTWAAQPGVQYLVQRFRVGDAAWLQRTDWLPEGTAAHDDATAVAGSTYVYRLRARSRAGLLNTLYAPVEVTLS